MKFLAEMNQYSMLGRYPKPNGFLPTTEYADKTIQKTEEIIKWLTNQL